MRTMSRLQIVTPAADLSLLTIEELRAAAGLAEGDTTHDAQLAMLGAEAAEWIAGEVLGIRSAGGRIPTVLAEGLRETFSPNWNLPDLVLARRFVSNVTVTENGMLLVEDVDFIVHDDRGVIERQMTGYRLCWWTAPIVVDYTAGFANGSPTSVPPLIRSVAADFVGFRYTAGSQDLGVQSETVNDIDSVTYRSGADSQDALGALGDAARSRLSRYVADMAVG